MQKLIRTFGVLFIFLLVALMVIPIGSGANNTFVAGFRGDYIIHLVIYLPWMFLRRMIFGEKVGKLCWLVVGILTVLALEYIQMLLPYRGFNVNDILAGEIGVIVSFALYRLSNIKNKQ